MSASYMRKYGTGTGADIYINIPKAGSANHAVNADWTPAAGDVKVSKDGGAAANIGTLPTAIAMGNSAIWKFVFTDAELQAAFISVTVSDSATKVVDDTGFSIETYGNASALHAFDLDTATQNVNVTQISGDSVAADNAESFFDGTGYAGTNNVIPTVTNLTNLPAAAALEATLTAMKGATFDGATDSLEALRNRGDAAWTTATGFSTLDAAGVRTAVGMASANLDTQLDALPTAAENAAAALTTAMTEAYRANGATATLAQAVYEILAHLGEASISGTTKTVKKLDHSTSAATFTLDDATTPSSITRAT